jgi:hypothetical protein
VGCESEDGCHTLREEHTLSVLGRIYGPMRGEVTGDEDSTVMRFIRYTILKYILRKSGERMCNGLIWLRIETSGGLL